jgi:hypothetical protein
MGMLTDSDTFPLHGVRVVRADHLEDPEAVDGQALLLYLDTEHHNVLRIRATADGLDLCDVPAPTG